MSNFVAEPYAVHFDLGFVFSVLFKFFVENCTKMKECRQLMSTCLIYLVVIERNSDTNLAESRAINDFEVKKLTFSNQCH